MTHRPVPLGLFWTALLAGFLGACHLGDLVRPAGPAPGTADTTDADTSGTDTTGTDTTGTDTSLVIVRFLTLAPADTTLTTPGDSVCLRWTARDSTGALVTGRTPIFVLTSNPAGRVALTATPGCVVALSVGNQGAARVTATLDSAVAEALIRANP